MLTHCLVAVGLILRPGAVVGVFAVGEPLAPCGRCSEMHVAGTLHSNIIRSYFA